MSPTTRTEDRNIQIEEGFLLLEDGSSYLLLEDDTSKIVLEDQSTVWTERTPI